MKLAMELTPSDFGVCSMYWWFRVSFGGFAIVDKQDWYSLLFETLCESLVDRCDLREKYEAAETDEEIEAFTLDSLCSQASFNIQWLAWQDMLVVYRTLNHLQLDQQSLECP